MRCGADHRTRQKTINRVIAVECHSRGKGVVMNKLMKSIIPGFLCLFSPLTVFAQERSVVDIFGGYSYTRISPETSVRRENLNGGHVSLTANGGFVGFSVDFSAYRGGSSSADVAVYNLMFGPQFGRQGKKVSWFVHSLYGVSRINTDVRLSPGLTQTSFAFVPGGMGLDIKLSERIAVRVLQADLLFIRRAYPLSSLNPRVSTGIVVRLGKR